MTEEQFKDFCLNESVKYANDPSTDRNFLAFQFLKAMLMTNVTNQDKAWVSYAFALADEFIKQGKK